MLSILIILLISIISIISIIIYIHFKEKNINIHLVMYSHGEPFDTVKLLTINSIHEFTNYNVIIHNYNFEKIKLLDWFYEIEYLTTINHNGKRDGYYNAWKPFIIKDVYNKINENDLLYYVDCSQYYKFGFTENINKLCNIAYNEEFIAGSVGDDILNSTINCCNNLSIWNIIIPNNDNSKFLDKKHVLNSWFILKKCNNNNNFINEWCYFTYYKYNNLPLIVYHHTVDQSIFNILVYKYNLLVFYDKNITHIENKNKNIILNKLNNNNNYKNFFIKLN